MAEILVVDDEPKICRVLTMLLEERGHSVHVSATGESAIEWAIKSPPDLALIDVNLPKMSGIDTFGALRKEDPRLNAVFITGSGTIRSAIAAMRAGAFDYLVKPFDNEELIITIDRALESRQLRVEVKDLREALNGRSSFPGIVGTSSAIQVVLRLMTKSAGTDATMLILGESGTGKELVARSLHRHSKRSSGPFVAVNCSAIPAGLVESEFFGHEAGAFTDAKVRRIGRFEQAHRGTLFLDEIGDLPLDAQAKLLRVLESREVTRVGSTRAAAIDVRLMAATNRDLETLVAEGEFREDLFWRLHVIAVHLPALRARKEDVPLLIDYLMDRLNVELGRTITGISGEARARLLSHDWPGNVRELENTLRRAMVLAENEVLDLGDLPGRFIQLRGVKAEEEPSSEHLTLNEAVERAITRVERGLIEATLAQHRGNRGATADALGINRKTLFNKMRAYRLTEQTTDDE